MFNEYLWIFWFQAVFGSFPLQKFFKGNKISSFLINWKERHLCDSVFMECSCDDRCIKSAECCIDVIWDEKKSNDSISYNDYTKDLLKYTARDEMLQCHPLISLPGTTSETYLMITDCPKSSKEKLSKKCEKSKGFPVLGNGYIYRNKYCAKCNNDLEYTNLNITAECPSIRNNSDFKNAIEKYNGCEFQLSKKSYHIYEAAQFCQPDVIGYCRTNTENCKMCNAYLAKVSYEGSCYRNVHCVLEFNSDVPEIYIFDGCLDLMILSDGFAFAFEPPSYSNLVSLSDFTPKCNSGETFNDLENSCVEVTFCNYGYEKKNGVCVKIKYENDVGNGKIFQSFDKDDLLQNCMQSTYIRQNETYVKNSIVSRNLSLLEYVSSSTKNMFLTQLYGFDFNRIFSDRICSIPYFVQENDFSVSLNCYVFYNKSILSPQEYVINIYTNRTKRKVELVICKQFHLSSKCNLKLIKEFTMFLNKSIQDLENGKVYHVEEYSPLENGLGYCAVSNAGSLSWSRVANAVERYITFIGCSLSIIGYIWTMLTFIIIPELNTVPGKNIVCLCSMLLTCDLVLLLTMVKNTEWCRISAYLLHFCSLSAQLWCGVLAYDIWSTFRGKNVMRDTNKLKHFFIYSSFSWGIPAFITVLIIVLEQSHTIDLGYGDNGVCWINNVTGRIATYMAPVIFVIMFTILTMSYTLCKIKKQNKKSDKLLKKTGGDDVSLARMALKLLVLLGGIEILGFIQISNSTEQGKRFNVAFRFIYSISRSFRGVMICLLYVVTDRVFKIYGEIRRTGSISTSRRKSHAASTSNTKTRTETVAL